MRRTAPLWSICLGIFMLAATGLYATQPFWSMEPSTQEIARADSLTGFDVLHYDISLSIDDQTQFLSGSVSALVFAEEPLTGLDFDLESDSLHVGQVLVNGVPAAYTHQDGILHIVLNMPQFAEFTVTVDYSGHPRRSPAPYNIGIIFTPNCVYTLSNPDAGRYYWPSYDHPWDKAFVAWHLTVRSDWIAVANGTRTGITDNGNGTRTHHWLSGNPVATYVMGFAAAPYIEFNQQAGSVTVQNFVLAGQLANAQADFANVPAMIAYFSDTFGPYPFEKYGHMIVPMTTYAAMEHQTTTTYGAAYLTGNLQYESIVAHELAHSWYGNHVTPITMREVWLKESFATYSEFLWKAHHYGWQAGCDYLRDYIQQYYISWENSNGPHTIFNPAYNLMFAPPTYEKSASVLHMLRLKLGNPVFFNFIRSIQTAFPGGNINTAEFIDLAEQASGQDLTQFFQQWIYSPGVPNATLSLWSNDAGLAKVVARSISPTATLFDLDIHLRLPGSAVADSVVVRATSQGYANYFALAAGDDLSQLQIDPNHWLLTRSLTQTTLQLSSCLAYNSAVDLTWNAFDADIPLAGYHVYRKQLPDGGFVRLTDTPLTSLAYTDVAVTNGLSYRYRIVAVDAEGFESLPSNSLDGSPLDFPFDQGFLVVDETRNGTGAAINPSDEMVDSFYEAVLVDFPHTVWDLDSQPGLNISDLSHHPLVLWHCDDFSDMQLVGHLNTLGSYVLSGGRLLISGWKYPSQFDAAFLNKFLPGITPVLNSTAVFVSANSDTYPDLHPDPAKLAAVWNGMLPQAYVFPGAAYPLYSAEILNGGPTDGQPAAFRVEHTGSLALLGFPLYYMLQDEVRNFLLQFLPQFYPDVAAADPLAPELPLALRCQPNPFSASARISVLLPRTETPASLTVFNLRGQRVRELAVPETRDGVCYLDWDGRDSRGLEVASGVYLLSLRNAGHATALKVLKLK